MRIAIGVLSAVLASGCLIRREALSGPPDADADAGEVPGTDAAGEEIDAPLDSPTFDAPACEGTLPLICDGLCIEGASDNHHCGACNNACEVGAHCEAGLCACDLDVLGGCEPGLRIWLDAQNTTGTGTAPEGALATWSTSPRVRAATRFIAAGTSWVSSVSRVQRAVRFSGGRISTSGPLARADTRTWKSSSSHERAT